MRITIRRHLPELYRPRDDFLVDLNIRQVGRMRPTLEVVVKLYVDITGKQFTVSRDPEIKKDQNGNQRSEKGTGRPMWSTQVFVLDETGGEVITVTTAGEKPNVKVGQLVALQQLEAIPWATGGRNGTAFRAVTLAAAGQVQSK
jgi:hypothetical protein